MPHLATCIFFFFQMNQNWVQKSIPEWLWHHFHLAYWMTQDSNPQPIDRESNLLTTRPDWRPGSIYGLQLQGSRKVKLLVWNAILIEKIIYYREEYFAICKLVRKSWKLSANILLSSLFIICFLELLSQHDLQFLKQ